MLFVRQRMRKKYLNLCVSGTGDVRSGARCYNTNIHACVTIHQSKHTYKRKILKITLNLKKSCKVVLKKKFIWSYQVPFRWCLWPGMVSSWVWSLSRLIPRMLFQKLQTKLTLPVPCSLDQYSSCLCIEDVCLGLKQEAVLLSVKT